LSIACFKCIIVFFDLDITVLLTLSFFQLLVSDHLPTSSDSVPVIGQSALKICCCFVIMDAKNFLKHGVRSQIVRLKLQKYMVT